MPATARNAATTARPEPRPAEARSPRHKAAAKAPCEDALHALYDEEYFERGVVSGVSGYMNYSWMPEATIRMAHYFVNNIPILPGQRVLDFGCAKGYVVRALRLLDVDAWGVDASEYAIGRADRDVAPYCAHVRGCADPELFARDYDLLLSKDVFEHIPEDGLRTLLTRALGHVGRIFTAIPLGRDDHSGRFVVPAYDQDVTHITAKSLGWWLDLFESCGWSVATFGFHFKGCKEHWTRRWNEGNGFFTLTNPAATDRRTRRAPRRTVNEGRTG